MNIFEKAKKESEENCKCIMREIHKRIYEFKRRDLVPQTILLDIGSYQKLEAYSNYSEGIKIESELMCMPLCGYDPRKLDEVRVHWNKDCIYFNPEEFSKAHKLLGLPIIVVMTGMQLIQIAS